MRHPPRLRWAGGSRATSVRWTITRATAADDPVIIVANCAAGVRLIPRAAGGTRADPEKSIGHRTVRFSVGLARLVLVVRLEFFCWLRWCSAWIDTRQSGQLSARDHPLAQTCGRMHSD